MSGDVIAAAISSINFTIEGVKALSKASGAIERAELKLQLAEMMGALAEVKLELTQAMEDRTFHQQQIARLEEALRIKETVRREGDAYYKLDENGNAVGEPYCLRCWEVEHRLHTLVRGRMGMRIRVCAVCNKEYSSHHAYTRAPTGGDADSSGAS